MMFWIGFLVGAVVMVCLIFTIGLTKAASINSRQEEKMEAREMI